MGIRAKLLLNTLVIVVCLGIVGGVGGYYTHRVARLSMRVVDNEAKPLLQLQALQEQILNLWLRQIVHASVTDLARMQELEAEIQPLAQRIDAEVDSLGRMYETEVGLHAEHAGNVGGHAEYVGESEHVQWQTFLERWRAFQKTGQEALGLSRDYIKDEALDLLLRKTGWEQYTQITTAMHALVAVHEHHLEDTRAQALDARRQAIWIISLLTVAIGLLALWIINGLTRRLTGPLMALNEQLKMLADGQPVDTAIHYSGRDELQELIHSARRLRESMQSVILQTNAVAAGNYASEVKLLSDRDQLGGALVEMTAKLREFMRQNALQNWMKNGQARLSETMSGEQDLVQLAEHIITFLTPYVEAQVGAFYLVTESHPEERQGRLKMLASYAYTRRKQVSNTFEFGEGLVGQAAREQKAIVVDQVPENYMYIGSGIGEAVPRHILVMPFLYENTLKGVIELGTFQPFTQTHLDFLAQVMPAVGIAVNTADSRTRMAELLAQTQAQAEELQAQTEELQTQSEELQTQQEELRQTNEELEERTKELERQQKAVEEQNSKLEEARTAIEIKAKELELASKYKSEFLANMSHELRTPLNSLLILAQLLAENKSGNLDQRQIEHAKTIHSAGSDLLTLINEILDLSKVEAGRVEVHVEDVYVPELMEGIDRKFRHMAEEKGLAFTLRVDDGLPAHLRTDGHRLKQVITNLLSNAFKFTEKGQVSLDIRRPAETEAGVVRARLGLPPAQSLAFSVTDTGIGIPEDKQQLVFEAFQQADGTTSRKYGGTGLGLTISRQLARLLGGDLHLRSAEGQGSTFTLYLPEKPPEGAKAAIQAVSPPAETPPVARAETPVAPAPATPAAAPPSPPAASASPDDRQDLQDGDKLLLLIEDDRHFSGILMELAREKGYKCLLAEDGRSGLELALEYKPQGIILDVGLPVIDGLTLLEKIKETPDIRHIPVHMVSASDETQDARRMGAIGYLLKPVTPDDLVQAFQKIEHFTQDKLRDLLVVVDNEARREEILELAGGQSVQVTVVADTAEAYRNLEAQAFDCLILDADAEQGRALALLEKLCKTEARQQLPVIVYANRELSAAEDALIQECTGGLTIKSVRSPERLADEAALFLHQLEASLPKEKRTLLRMAHDKESLLRDKTLLIVDDDMRNTYALTTALEERDMQVLAARNGKKALEVLDKHPEIDLVLMDIMMPEMDGYETMRAIRAQERFRKLPIIALTAKAMKGDKAKCIEAGANDYLAKPVDTNKLLSLLRVWLYR